MPPALRPVDIGDEVSNCTSLDERCSVSEAPSICSKKPEAAQQPLGGGGRVRFSSELTVHYVDKISSDDARHVWHTEESYNCIRDRNFLLIELEEAGLFDEAESEHSYRGLERFTVRAKQRQALAATALFQEQCRQQARDIYNPIRIAEIYHGATGNASETARERAKQDEVEALSSPAPPSPPAPAQRNETRKNKVKIGREEETHSNNVEKWFPKKKGASPGSLQRRRCNPARSLSKIFIENCLRGNKADSDDYDTSYETSISTSWASSMGGSKDDLCAVPLPPPTSTPKMRSKRISWCVPRRRRLQRASSSSSKSSPARLG